MRAWCAYSLSCVMAHPSSSNSSSSSSKQWRSPNIATSLHPHVWHACARRITCAQYPALAAFHEGLPKAHPRIAAYLASPARPQAVNGNGLG